MPFNPFVGIDDNMTDAGDVVSVEVFQQLAQNCNYLIDSMPIGSIVPICVGLAGVPIPNTDMWQECDGSIITNANSPMHGQTTPDHRGRYLKGQTTTGTIGFYGGSNTKTLQHSHGGGTSGASNIQVKGVGGLIQDWHPKPNQHSHSISNDLTTHNFEPVHIRIKDYIKIF